MQISGQIYSQPQAIYFPFRIPCVTSSTPQVLLPSYFLFAINMVCRMGSETLMLALVLASLGFTVWVGGMMGFHPLQGRKSPPGTLVKAQWLPVIV